MALVAAAMVIEVARVVAVMVRAASVNLLIVVALLVAIIAHLGRSGRMSRLCCLGRLIRLDR